MALGDVGDIGDSAVLGNTFTVDGVVEDPTTVTLFVKDPSGNIDTYTWAGGTVTRVSEGVFTKTIDVDESGKWRWKWKTTGAAKGVSGGEFEVRHQMVEG